MGDGLPVGPLLSQGVRHSGGRLRVREAGGGQRLSPYIPDHKTRGGMSQVVLTVCAECIAMLRLIRGLSAKH